MATWQRSLFDPGEEVGLSPLEGALSRTELGEGAWLDVLPLWVARHDLLFDDLVGSVPWQAERRAMYDRMVDVPRMVAFYQEGDELPHPLLTEMLHALNRHYGVTSGGPMRTTGLCHYRSGQDSVAWHGDRIGRNSEAETMVGIVSLGQRRRLLLRPRGTGPAKRFDLGEGDLVVMGGTCQRLWEHSVPKTSRPVGSRISVQFRTSGAG
jgi:alkylated DNA repair dioxygenase AlkB